MTTTAPVPGGRPGATGPAPGAPSPYPGAPASAQGPVPGHPTGHAPGYGAAPGFSPQPIPGPAPAPPLQRPPLRRPPRHPVPVPSAWVLRPGRDGAPVPRPQPAGRALAGVCAGLAVHLDQPVLRVRLLMAALTLVGGAGALLYVLLAVAVPAGDPWAEAAGIVPPARARLAARPRSTRTGAGRVSTLTGGAALLAAAVLLLAWRAGALTGLSGGSWLVPLLVVTCGAALAWSQVDDVTGPDRDAGAVLRLLGGVLLAVVGILLWVGADTPPRVLLTGAATGGALVLGIGLVLAPLWLRTNRALADTRAAEAREAERADIAAHLHDSVLQTLTLIRKRADEPETVARLARSQERELRAWLYTDRPEAGTSVADALRDLVGEIEDRYAAPVELVVVGDRAPDRDTEVVIAAAREALSNAVRHGAPPVSVYAEIGADRLEVFVRDRGPGFDPAVVAPDRHGVRESIIGRMARHGGLGAVRRLERGTEVRLVLPAPEAPARPRATAQPPFPTTPGETA